MTEDLETIQVYEKRAADYVKLGPNQSETLRLNAFIASLSTSAVVLDYGCGPGHAAAAMDRAGLSVDAMDASREMVRMCSEYQGINVMHRRFDQFDAENRYDGIWASFSLLHAQKSEFPALLAAIRKALKPTGQFWIGMKLGSGEARDKLGRFYAYYTQGELETHLTNARFSISEVETGTSKGLAGSVDPHIAISAHA